MVEIWHNLRDLKGTLKVLLRTMRNSFSYTFDITYYITKMQE